MRQVSPRLVVMKNYNGGRMLLTGPITIREATSGDIPFLHAMIWEAILASSTLLVQDGLETMQQYEEHYWKSRVEHPDPAFVALDATGCKLGAITVKPTIPVNQCVAGV